MPARRPRPVCSGKRRYHWREGRSCRAWYCDWLRASEWRQACSHLAPGWYPCAGCLSSGAQLRGMLLLWQPGGGWRVWALGWTCARMSSIGKSFPRQSLLGSSLTGPASWKRLRLAWPLERASSQIDSPCWLTCPSLSSAWISSFLRADCSGARPDWRSSLLPTCWLRRRAL